jgi:solute carrier family 35 (UDP-galactose transporter), member B1
MVYSWSQKGHATAAIVENMQAFALQLLDPGSWSAAKFFSVLESDVAANLGPLLLVGSLMFDGFTSLMQDGDVHGLPMMFQLNLWSLLWTGVGTVLSGELVPFLNFWQAVGNDIMLDLFTFGLSSALGQIFIFSVIESFGPLTLSIITTTRKFFTVLASVVYFQHPLNSQQWTAMFVVVGALLVDSYFGSLAKRSRAHK